MHPRSYAPAGFTDRRTTTKHPAAVLGAVAVTLYGVSFFLPAVGTVLGFLAFIWAPSSVVLIPMWLANPVFWYGLHCLFGGRLEAAAKAGLVALLLALSESWLFWGELGVGYFAWVGSMAALARVGIRSGTEGTDPFRTIPSPFFLGGEASRIAARFRR